MQFLLAFNDQEGMGGARSPHAEPIMALAPLPVPPLTKTYMRLNWEGPIPVATSPVTRKITAWVMNQTRLIQHMLRDRVSSFSSFEDLLFNGLE